jgi:hypothetical protein
MQPFKSADQMLDAHEAMFGAAGKQAAEIVLEWAPQLFAEPLNPLSVRVVLAPVELDRLTATPAVTPRSAPELRSRQPPSVPFLRRQVVLNEPQGFGTLSSTSWRTAARLHCCASTRVNRAGLNTSASAHRDKGWYSAIAEAAPNYLGVEVPADVWPKRNNPDT